MSYEEEMSILDAGGSITLKITPIFAEDGITVIGYEKGEKTFSLEKGD